MRSIVTLGFKDLRLLWNDRLGLFWIVAFPLVFALFFGSIMGGMGGGGRAAMRIAVIDRDESAGSLAFVRRLAESSALDVDDALTVKEAKNAVRRGKLVAYLVVKEGYGDSWGVFGGQDAAFEIGIDPARRAEAGILQGIVTEATFRGMQDRFADPAAMRELVAESMTDLDTDEDLGPAQRAIFKTFLAGLDTFLATVDPEVYKSGPQTGELAIESVSVTRDTIGPRSGFEIAFPSAMLWGVLACSAGFAISLVKERSEGTFLRLKIAPVSLTQILAGKGLACFVACIAVIALLLLVGRVLFEVRVNDSVCMAMAGVCTAACFVGLMMFLSVLGKTEQSVAGSGWAIITVMAMFGGGMIPLAFMPSWMVPASHVSPVKWGILALEGAIWRGFSLTEMLLPCGILLAVGVAFFTIGVKILARSEA